MNNYKPGSGLEHELDYGLDSIMDSLIDCNRTVTEHLTLQIQMNQLQCNRCFIFITCNMGTFSEHLTSLVDG